MEIEVNAQFQKAISSIEAGENVFITGRAGTGKSTLLSYFREHSLKKIVVLAPTGVAAVNVKGQTIHSFFGFLPDITIQKVKKKKEDGQSLYKKLEIIVIDEISMVRADLLDCVDKFLRLNGNNPQKPFGGVQMVFIGDLYQLPPVVTGAEKEIFKTRYESPYFFSAEVFDAFEMEFVELEKIYRQKDDDFIHLLNAIRNRSHTSEDFSLLNTRHDADFEPQEDLYISLTTTNALADERNSKKLAQLSGKVWRSSAEIFGEVGKEHYPNALTLELKIGAQVMLLNNDSSGRWVNGTIGKVLDIIERDDEDDIVLVELENGKVVEIAPYTWEIFAFTLQKGEIVSEVMGTFTQYPIRLAFAITIHKSQGKTFQKVIIDVGRGTFAHGQMYVALSRCTTLEGLVLRQRIQPAHVRLDYAVVQFLTKYQYSLAEKVCSVEDREEIIRRAIQEKKAIRIVYLKGKDEKSERKIRPLRLGKMEYAKKSFLGVEGFCLLRNEERVFNVARILEIEILR